MKNNPNNGVSSEFLLTAATALSIQITKCCTLEEVGLLAAFFTVLGDNLELLALNMVAEDT